MGGSCIMLLGSEMQRKSRWQCTSVGGESRWLTCQSLIGGPKFVFSWILHCWGRMRARAVVTPAAKFSWWWWTPLIINALQPIQPIDGAKISIRRLELPSRESPCLVLSPVFLSLHVGSRRLWAPQILALIPPPGNYDIPNIVLRSILVPIEILLPNILMCICSYYCGIHKKINLESRFLYMWSYIYKQLHAPIVTRLNTKIYS